MIFVLAKIKKVKEILTKKGEKMAFIEITNQGQSFELVCFPNAYQKYKTQCVTQFPTLHCLACAIEWVKDLYQEKALYMVTGRKNYIWIDNRYKKQL